MKVKLINPAPLNFDDKLRHLTLSATENGFVATIEDADKIPAKDLENLFWIWEVVKGAKISFSAANKNPSINGGRTTVNPVLPRIYSGGGVGYLEPFYERTGPTNSTKNGITVSLEGTPGILGYEWRKDNIANNGEVIKDITQRFGDTVQLHVYTEALYGQELNIQLIDVAGFDEDLDIYEKEDLQYKNLPDKDKDISQQNKPPISKLKLFEREVRAYDYLADTELIIPEKSRYNSKVQKCILRFYIDPIWSFIVNRESKPDGNFAHIQPLFTCNSKKVEIVGGPKLRKLYAAGLSKTMYQSALYPTGNQVALVGDNQIETNPAYYQACNFRKVTLKTQTKKEQEVIFDLDIPAHRLKNNIEIDIIAGKKEVKIIDIDFDTIECERTPSHHLNEIKVLSTSSPEMTIQVDNQSTNTQHVVEKKPVGWYKTSSSSAINILGYKTKSTNKYDPTDKTTKFDSSKEVGVITVRANQIEFDAFYNYDIPSDKNSISTFVAALKYLWLPNLGDKIITYNFNLESCVYSKKLIIAIYPDIKWTLKFGFNVTKKTIETLNVNGFSTPIEFYTLESKTGDAQAIADKKEEKFLKESKTHKNIRHAEINKLRKEYKLPKKAKKQEGKDIEPIKEGNFSGLIDVFKKMNISLAETHYGGTEVNELSSQFIENLYEKYKASIEILAKIAEVIDGDHDKSNAGQDKSITDYLNDGKSVAGLREKLQRKPVAYSVLYPKIALAASWYYDKIDGKKHPHLAGKQGLGIDVNLSAKPLLGVEIRWDLLELLCRKHPIAYAALKAIDGLLYVLGNDESAITLDAIFTGKIDTEVEWKHNMLLGPKSVTAQCKASIQLDIILNVNIAAETHILNTKLIIELGFSLKGTTGIGISTKIGIDDAGFYSEETLVFEGITFDFKAVGIAQLKKKKGSKKDETPLFELGGEISGTITFGEYKTTLPRTYYI